MLHAPAAILPNLAVHQCTTTSTQPSTPAKPARVVNTQCNQSAVQSSTEPKVPAPPCVPAPKVAASCASHTSMAACQSSCIQDVPEHLIK